jgi:hypothetical protein
MLLTFLMILKDYYKNLVSFGLVQNVEISGFAMDKAETVNFTVTYLPGTNVLANC